MRVKQCIHLSNRVFDTNSASANGKNVTQTDPFLQQCVAFELPNSGAALTGRIFDSFSNSWKEKIPRFNSVGFFVSLKTQSIFTLDGGRKHWTTHTEKPQSSCPKCYPLH